jgi:hypothetical protein
MTAICRVCEMIAGALCQRRKEGDAYSMGFQFLLWLPAGTGCQVLQDRDWPLPPILQPGRSFTLQHIKAMNFPMAAHLQFLRLARRIFPGALHLDICGRPMLSRPDRLSSAPFSNSAMSQSSDSWSPPPEPDKPAVPYRKGFQFTARRVKPPPPFLQEYYEVPTGRFRDSLDEARLPGKEYLRTTNMVDYCSSAAARPLPCEELGDTATFEVLEELAVGDGCSRGRGSQVVTCARQEGNEPLVAKIYDPLYYPFADDEVSSTPNDVVARAEHDFALESAAYAQLDDSLGGSIIPKFHGSWVLNLPLKDLTRPVGFILVEHVKGVPLDTLNPSLYPKEARLRVLAQAMEAEVRLHFAGVLLDDIAPRNLICSDSNLLAEDLRVRIIDFNSARIMPLLGADAPASPRSCLGRFDELQASAGGSAVSAGGSNARPEHQLC